MFKNPELVRNFWLDFTWHRIFLTPIIIILTVYLFYLTGGKTSGASIALNLACFFIFLWGTRKASETVIEEVNNNTWDLQRQSSISPWTMTWGKLLGSSLFSWFGAAICLYCYCLLRVPDPHLTLGEELAILLLGGLLCQALALLFSMQLLPQVRRDRTNKTFKYFLAGLIIGVSMTSFCFKAMSAGATQLTWHDRLIPLGPFAMISLILFLGWAIIGLQRAFCKELQFHNIPWIWALFNVFCMVYFSGFISFKDFPQFSSTLNITSVDFKLIQQQLLQIPYYISFFIVQLLTYIALFTDEITAIRYKRLSARMKEKNIKESLQLIPWWSISYILTLVAGFIVIYHQPTIHDGATSFSPSIFIMTSMLFLLRDLLLIHFFNFGKNPRKANGSAVLYLFMLYLLFPMLMQALHLNHLYPTLLPSWGQNTLLALFSLAIQLGLLGWLCLKRWELIWQEPKRL